MFILISYCQREFWEYSEWVQPLVLGKWCWFITPDKTTCRNLWGNGKSAHEASLQCYKAYQLLFLMKNQLVSICGEKWGLLLTKQSQRYEHSGFNPLSLSYPISFDKWYFMIANVVWMWVMRVMWNLWWKSINTEASCTSYGHFTPDTIQGSTFPEELHCGDVHFRWWK